MKRNMPKREKEFDFDKIAMDFDDTLVQSVDGLITDGDDEEIKLFFFYVKPESYINEDEVKECKCVVELRVSCNKLTGIANEINEKMKDIQNCKEVMVMFG
jgi:hypothetical protein